MKATGDHLIKIRITRQTIQALHLIPDEIGMEYDTHVHSTLTRWGL